MSYIIAALVLFNFLTVFCGWRLAQVRRKRQARKWPRYDYDMPRMATLDGRSAAYFVDASRRAR